MGNLLQPVLDKYLKDFFTNFTVDKMKVNLTLTNFEFNNLIFSQKILEGAAIPIRMKFGMLGSLQISIQSYFNLSECGVKIKLSNLCLCLEMLEVNKWDENLVVKKYQENKKSSLKTLQNNTEIFFSEFHQDDTAAFSPEYLQKIIANTTIEIENVFLMYVDDQFNFQIGLMIPKIEVKSMDKLWQAIELVEDTSVLYKLLAVHNISFFVNVQDHYRDIDQLLSQTKLEGRKSFDYQDTWTASDRDQVVSVFSDFIHDSFEDSNKRCQPGYKTKNNYVFLQSFIISLQMSLTLNKQAAKQLLSTFNEPDLKLQLYLGNESDYLTIDLEEEQLEALLHLSTFFSAFGTYSSGVTREKFHSNRAKQFTKEDRQKYIELFRQFLQAKQLKQSKTVDLIEKQLWEYDQLYRTDILLLIRQAVIDNFYEKLILESQLQKDIQSVDSKQSSWPWHRQDTLTTVKVGQLKLVKQDKCVLADEAMMVKLHQIETKIMLQFDDIEDFEVEEAIEEREEEVGKWYEVFFSLPKLTLTLHQSSTLQQNKKRMPMCIISIQGLETVLDMKTFPSIINANFSLDSIQIEDHKVREEIIKKNPGLSEQVNVSTLVLATWNKETNEKLINVSYSQLEDKVKPESQQLDDEVFNVNNKEMKTIIKIDVMRELLVYCNIFFVNKMIKLATRVFKDMNVKRDKLISSALGQDDVKRHIQNGFQLLAKIRELAASASEAIDKQKIAETRNNSLKLSFNVKSPKLIIDEYLLAEEVQDAARPCYFLIDMGNWRVSNGVVTVNIEVEPLAEVYRATDSVAPVTRRDFLFETWDVTIADIKIVYNYHSYESLLIDEENLNFQVFSKFTFGLQYQTLVTDVDDPALSIPRSQVNLKFKKLKLFLERSVFRQLLKIKTFATEGSFAAHLKDLAAVMANFGPPEDPVDIKQAVEKSIVTHDDKAQYQMLEDDIIRVTTIQKEDAVHQKVQSSMRINILFQGFEIKAQTIRWIRESPKLVKFSEQDILSIEAQDFKITVHMSDINSQMSVIVLMNELRIKDLNNPLVVDKYSNLIKVAPKHDFKVVSSPQKQPQKTMSAPLKGFGAIKSRLSRRVISQFPNIQKRDTFSFDDFNKFSPREDFLKQKDQVCVYFGASAIEELPFQMQKSQTKDSNTIVKISQIQLIAHFKLIIQVMQTVFDCLDDLKTVEKSYKDHLHKHQQQARVMLNKAADYWKDKSQDKAAGQLLKLQHIFQTKPMTKRQLAVSTFNLKLQQIKLIIPTDIEQDNCLSLILSTDFNLCTSSKEQLIVEYTSKAGEADVDGAVKSLDKVNLIKMKLENFKTYIESTGGRKKTKEDYIISPLVFKFIDSSVSYANHDLVLSQNHSITEQHKRTRIQESFGQHPIDRMTVSEQVIETVKPFNLQFRVQQMNMYLQIIHLILAYQSQIGKVEALPFVEDHREFGINDKFNLLKKKTKDVIEGAEKKTVQVAASTVKQTMLEEESRMKLTLEKLVQNYLPQKKKNQRFILGAKKVENKQTRYEILCSNTNILTNGISFCLLDDVTSQYEEPLLKVSFADLDLLTKQLQSSVEQNIVLQEESFKTMREVMLRSGLVATQDLVKMDQSVQIEFQAQYYNYKSHGEESLIERYKAQYSTKQLSPMSEQKVKITSDEVFNLNLTYGCILSLYKVLQYLTDDDDVNQKTIVRVQEQQSQSSLSDVVQVKDVRQLPRFEFNNYTGKPITFSIINESYDQLHSQFGISENNTPLYESQDIYEHVRDLLTSLQSEEIKHAQLYLNFEIKGYPLVEHLSLNQIGIFGFKLQPHYCCVRIVRNKDQTVINFESNSVFQNNKSTPVWLLAWQEVHSVMKLQQKVIVDSGDVFCLPLQWFENNYKLQIELTDTQVYNQHQCILRHGNLSQVLNPKIVRPYHNHSQQIKLGTVWTALEVALLSTRTKHHQFLIMLHSLTKMHNLMFYPLEVIAGVKKERGNVHEIDTNKAESIEELNLESTHMKDQSFVMKITQEDNVAYEAIIQWSEVVQDRSLKHITKGSLIELHLKRDKLIAGKENTLDQKHTLIMEKVTTPEMLEECRYNNFSLRQIIYHHGARQRYELYTPFVAVNETSNDINILNKDNKLVNQVKSQSQTSFNLRHLLYQKIKLQVQGFNSSELIDLTSVGLHGTVTLKQDRKALEIGTSIKLADSPYAKTKVIRFTNSFTVINKMDSPIVVQCIVLKKQYIIDKKQKMAIDFAASNVNKELQLRVMVEGEYERYMQNQTLFSEQQVLYQQWSKKISGKIIDDFQVFLPIQDKSADVDQEKSWDYDALNRRIIRVTTSSNPVFNEVTYCIISQPPLPDYLFINYLDEDILIRDKLNVNMIAEANCVSVGKAVAGKPSALPIVLSQFNTDKIIIIQTKTQKIKYCINELVYRDKVSNVKLTSRVQGTIRIIEIFADNHSAEASELNHKRDDKIRVLTDKLRTLGFEHQNKDAEPAHQAGFSNVSLDLNLAGIGISFVDFKPHELCYISFDSIKLVHSSIDIKRGLQDNSFFKLDLTIQNFQIDAMQNEVFPVLFGPVVPYRNIERQFQKQIALRDKSVQKSDMIQDCEPIFQLCVRGNSDSEKEITTSTIEQFLFALQPVEFKLHISLVMEIQELVNSLMQLTSGLDTLWKSEFFKQVNETSSILEGRSKKQISQSSSTQNQDKLIFNPDQSVQSLIEQISRQRLDELCPMLTVDFSRTFTNLNPKKLTKTQFESAKINAIKMFMTLRIRGIESILQKRGPMSAFLNLGSNFADITDAEFNFTELEMSRGMQAEQTIYANLISHYKNEALQQFYQVLGSQDIIGNPSSFIANVSRGTENFYNEPLEGLVDRNYQRAASGVLNSLKGILQNTGIAVTNSYTGFSGSVYLGLKNACGAGLTHTDLDRPLTCGGGIKKGIYGLGWEVVNGVTGIYTVPQNKIQTQGFGAPQLVKGIGQGLLQFSLSPVSAALRASYDISAGTKCQLKGVKDHGQRYRYPRFFDQNDRMHPYNCSMAHAHTALLNAQKGRYKHEVIQKVYDVSHYAGKGNFTGFYKPRVIVFTNKSIMFIMETRKILARVLLTKITGMMFYFQNQMCDSIIVQADEIVKMKTDLPEQNKEIMSEIKQAIEKLSNLKQHQQHEAVSVQPREQSHPDVVINFENSNLGDDDKDYYLTWETIPNSI